MLSIMSAGVLVITFYKPDRLVMMYVMVGGTIFINLVYLIGKMINK
jgi:hypothetical protein